MDDPFELHCSFCDLLRKPPSSENVKRVVQFAYGKRNIYETLFSSLSDSLSNPSLSHRLNTLFYIDAIARHSAKSSFKGYLNLALANISDIVDKTIDCVRADGLSSSAIPSLARPPHPEGIANAPHVKKIVSAWSAKGFLSQTIANQLVGLLDAWPSLAHSSDAKEPSREAVLRRIEDDRERQKKSREEAWLRPSQDHPDGITSSPDPEFASAWAKHSQLSNSDYSLMEEYRAKMDMAVHERNMAAYRTKLKQSRSISNTPISVQMSISPPPTSNPIQPQMQNLNSSDPNQPSIQKEIQNPPLHVPFPIPPPNLTPQQPIQTHPQQNLHQKQHHFQHPPQNLHQSHQNIQPHSFLQPTFPSRPFQQPPHSSSNQYHRKNSHDRSDRDAGRSDRDSYRSDRDRSDRDRNDRNDRFDRDRSDRSDRDRNDRNDRSDRDRNDRSSSRDQYGNNSDFRRYRSSYGSYRDHRDKNR